jgi:hypothetical protein
MGLKLYPVREPMVTVKSPSLTILFRRPIHLASSVGFGIEPLRFAWYAVFANLSNYQIWRL